MDLRSPLRHSCVRSALLLGIVAALVMGAAPGLFASEGLLTRAFPEEQLRRHLIPASRWHPFPRATERAGWLALPEGLRAASVRAGESLWRAPWPLPRASEFLAFVRTGDRSGYQHVSFGRREQLAALVVAECIDGRGRFRDDIIDGIWTICEETYWGVPAHVGLQKAGNGLPDVAEPTVDLFAAETGSLLAWTSYLLRDSLDAVSPLVVERIRHEVDRRINAVNLARDDFWWMGHTRTVNNWTPWICSNWLTTVLILEEDQEKRVQAVRKIMECLDRFIAVYEDDGGCDEGPLYWTRAAASLFDCLELLHAATDGHCDVYGLEKIREMGRFIIRARIRDPWFVNFADAAARLEPEAPVIYRYGRAIGDEAMAGYGARLAQERRLGDTTLAGRFGVLGRVLPGLFVMREMLEARPVDPYIRDSWFGGTQVMIARSREGSSDGLFLAAQGGHNEESHNHNDVGNVIVALDGEPLIIDVGVETYTAKTFSPDRYSIWTMQSGYHNLPTINGVEQRDGRAFAATDVRYHADDRRATLSMELAGAYPPEAGIRTWQRTSTLERGKEVVIRDAWELSAVREPVRFTYMTCREPVAGARGELLLGPAPAMGLTSRAVLHFDGDRYTAAIERIGIHDPQLRASWGEALWRIQLTGTGKSAADSTVVRIRAQH